MCYIEGMLKALPIAGLVFIALPAHAQLDTLPRFDALDRQFQMEEQRQVDQLESARQRERDLSSLPGSGVSVAEQAMRDMEYRRERERLSAEGGTGSPGVWRASGCWPRPRC